jgi:hypothetical protein
MSESRMLSSQEKEKMKHVYVELNKLWDMEETKARRAREKDIKEGDRNTRYFRSVANHGRRKVTLYNLDGPEGAVESTEEILKVATDYYKELFKKEMKPDMNIDPEFFSEEDKVTEEKNVVLEAELTEEEVKKAVFESYSDGAPGPDGLSFMFYQKIWGIIKNDLLAMFQEFFCGRLDLYRLNFALITIIPKEKDARTMSKFRPISLLNYSYKIFTKVLTNRIGGIVDRLVASNQTTFIKGRYILESVVTTHEILHNVHQSKQQGLVLKLD